MNQTINIQAALNEIGGIKCTSIYFAGKHMTVNIEYKREITPHLDSKIRNKIELHKLPGYNYTITYTKPNKNDFTN